MGVRISPLLLKKYTYRKMKLARYIKDAYNELVNKVSWPTWKELQSNSILVLVASLLIAVVIFGMDFGFERLFTFMYGNF